MLLDRYVMVFLLTIFLSTCQFEQTHIPNTPTTGQVAIWADNSFEYILPPALHLFESIYKNASIRYKFKSEAECIQGLLNDSCKVIFISRPLSKQELVVFQANNLIIHQTPVAYSAVALVGKPFKETGIELQVLKNILTEDRALQIVFFKKQNGAILYVKDSLLSGKDFGPHCFVLEDSAAFRKYIFEHTNVMGILDYSYICDDDDKWIRSFKYPQHDTLLIPLRRSRAEPAYYPDQSNIATRAYPLVRCIYCIRRGDDFSLSAGVESFVAGEKGQILFKKMGLVPVMDRERRLEFKPY